MNVEARRLRTSRVQGLTVGPRLAIASIRDPIFTTSLVPVPVPARFKSPDTGLERRGYGLGVEQPQRPQMHRC